VRDSLGDLEPIFQDRSGLRENGEVLFADARGAALTRCGIRCNQRSPAPVEAVGSALLAGDSGETTPDYRDTMVISGFRRPR
jgi:hypothetical protein